MNRWIMIIGKTNNSKLKGEPLEILRVASEEIHEHKASNNEKYYTGYINRVLELVPEKDVSDDFSLLSKLAKLEAEKMGAHAIARLE